MMSGSEEVQDLSGRSDPLSTLPTYRILYDFVLRLRTNLPDESTLPELAVDVLKRTWSGLRRKLSECVPTSFLRRALPFARSFTTEAFADAGSPLPCPSWPRSCSDLVLASTQTSWPFKPTTVTPQVDVERFNRTFLSLLALQLE